MKKLLSLILALALCLSAIPFAVTAFAADTDNEYIYFGSYPQSKVEDYWILGELNALAPDWDNWTSYGYYSGTSNIYSTSISSMVQGDWMRYFDVTFNGEKYRGVKFTAFRPMLTHYVSESTYQETNGYNTDTVYWFKFEPLKWRILDKDTGLVVCETIIDSQPYNNTIYVNAVDGDRTYAYFGDSSHTNYANDYETSSIRQWLNADFFNTAFTDSEKKAISETTLKNDGYYTLTGTSGYEGLDSDATNDKIFLLSYDEVLNAGYGFSSSSTDYDTQRMAQGSDYAKCQGLYVRNHRTDKTYNGNSRWLLRSSGTSSDYSCYVNYTGRVNHNSAVECTSYGIRPAMTLDIFDGGTGTQDNPYQIATLGQLEAFRGSVNAGNDYEGKYITLTNNIDMSEKYGDGKENWTPIGVFKGRLNGNDREGAMPFKGTFDGNGYAVIGLYIYNNDPAYYKNCQALFSYNAESGVIKNLTVYGCVFEGENCAGIVAHNYGTVSNCINNAEVHGTYTIGGVVAYNAGGVITNCVNNGYINVEGNQVGGIVAYCSQIGNDANFKIEKCYNTGEVQGIGIVGGIVGRVDSYLIDNCISNCYNVGDIYAFGHDGDVGAVIGYAETNYVTLNSLFNIGTIGYGDVGGIIGRYSNIDNRYSTGGTNTYYLEDCYDKDEDVETTLNSYGTSMSAEAFKDGTVTALLQGDQSEQIWKQGKEHPELVLDYSKMSTKITFDVDGVTKTEYINGEAFSKLDAPTKDGFTFSGWYTDKDCTDGNEYTFGDSGCSDITIYAKWIENAKPVQPSEPTTPTTEKTLADYILDVILELIKAIIIVISK